MLAVAFETENSTRAPEALGLEAPTSNLAFDSFDGFLLSLRQLNVGAYRRVFSSSLHYKSKYIFHLRMYICMCAEKTPRFSEVQAIWPCLAKCPYLVIREVQKAAQEKQILLCPCHLGF